MRWFDHRRLEWSIATARSGKSGDPTTPCREATFQHFHRRSIQRVERGAERPPRTKGEKRSPPSGNAQRRWYGKTCRLFRRRAVTGSQDIVSYVDAVLLVFNHDSLLFWKAKSCKALSTRPISLSKRSKASCLFEFACAQTSWPRILQVASRAESSEALGE